MVKTIEVVDFKVPEYDYAVESHNGVSPPRVGETVEVGARFKDGERIDSSELDFDTMRESQYRDVLRGEVVDITRHYHNSKERVEVNCIVTLEYTRDGHGYDPKSGLQG